MASRSLNSVHLIGRLGRDSETRFLPNGTAMTKFSMACDHRYKNGDEWVTETDWISVVVWGQEKLGEYLTKGTQVYVGGRISSRSYEKDGKKVYVTEVVGDTVIPMGGKDATEKRPEPDGDWAPPPRETGPRKTAAEALGYDKSSAKPTPAKHTQPTVNEMDDDPVPF